MILVALATLGAVAVAFVLYPVFSQEGSETLSPAGDRELELRDLEEKKNRLYEGITDLDFEKDAGKVSPADYEAARNDYLTQVAAVLDRLDALSPKKGAKKKPAETEPPARPKFCEACGEALSATARFCPGCGKKIS